MTTIRIAIAPRGLPRRRADQGAATYTATDVARRCVNVAIALTVLLLGLPLLLLIAIAVKLSSPGPVFYTQTRIGVNRRRSLPPGARYRQADYGGKPFTIFKFRTMRASAGAQDEPGQVWATPDDPRVTRVGRLLRLYRFDELPQLVNVLLGDMDIVGPRPEQPAIFARLREQIPRYQERQRVRPGITGWAQINQQYDASIEDVRKKLAFDLEYIGRRSLQEDLRIMVRTLPVIAGKLGAW
jgi:lipopolysaccharide/colanic/teichoic acid biosynthesis glycosyltransferase